MSATHGPLDHRGRSTVTLLCGHRIFDGVPAAAALDDLEDTMRGAICHEVALLARVRAA